MYIPTPKRLAGALALTAAAALALAPGASAATSTFRGGRSGPGYVTVNV